MMKNSISILFTLVALTFTGCNQKSGESTEATEEPGYTIELSEINYDELSEETQSQIEGAGCGFSDEKDGNPILVNGLMKINGVYELMQWVETGDSKTILYINKNWEFQLTVEQQQDDMTGSIMEGTATLKSRTSEQQKTFKAYGGCGC